MFSILYSLMRRYAIFAMSFALYVYLTRSENLLDPSIGIIILFILAWRSYRPIYRHLRLTHAEYYLLNRADNADKSIYTASRSDDDVVGGLVDRGFLLKRLGGEPGKACYVITIPGRDAVHDNANYDHAHDVARLEYHFHTEHDERVSSFAALTCRLFHHFKPDNRTYVPQHRSQRIYCRSCKHSWFTMN